MIGSDFGCVLQLRFHHC